MGNLTYFMWANDTAKSMRIDWEGMEDPEAFDMYFKWSNVEEDNNTEKKDDEEGSAAVAAAAGNPKPRPCRPTTYEEFGRAANDVKFFGYLRTRESDCLQSMAVKPGSLEDGAQSPRLYFKVEGEDHLEVLDFCNSVPMRAFMLPKKKEIKALIKRRMLEDGTGGEDKNKIKTEHVEEETKIESKVDSGYDGEDEDEEDDEDEDDDDGDDDMAEEIRKEHLMPLIASHEEARIKAEAENNGALWNEVNDNFKDFGGAWKRYLCTRRGNVRVEEKEIGGWWYSLWPQYHMVFMIQNSMFM